MMIKYHKIQTVYLRDPATKHKTLLEWQYALPEFEYLAANKWVFTEKIDGTNIRVGWNPEPEVGVPFRTFAGRTENAQIPAFLVTRLLELFTEDKLFALYPETPMTLYGEGYGAKIQKGGGNYIPDGVDFILFDVMVGDCWLMREDVEDIAGKLGIGVVPIVGRGTLTDAVEMVRSGFQSRVGTQIAEGLVMRPAIELITRRGHRVITKVKYKDFVR